MLVSADCRKSFIWRRNSIWLN